MADKLTQLVLMISLIRRRRIILPLLILFCAKEAVQGFLRWLVLRNCGEVHSSEWFGKASTATLFLVMGTLILFPGLPDLPASLMLLACGTMLIVSLAGYAAHDLKLLRSRREDPSGSRSGL